MNASEQMGHSVTKFARTAEKKKSTTNMKTDGHSSEEIFKLEDRYGAHK